MLRQIATAALALSASGLLAQTPLHSPLPRPKFDAFEVATIKPVENDAKSGRYLIMQGTNRFIGKNYTVKLLIAAAYSLSPKTISGGPAWIESDHWDIAAVTPGDLRPNHDEQMSMLRTLLADRFKLTFHRDKEDLPVYAITVTKAGPKLASSLGDPNGLPDETGDEDRMGIAMRYTNVSMADLAANLQAMVGDGKPVVDHTGLTGRFDFTLKWTREQTQSTDPNAAPGLFTAIQEQLGLKLEPVKAPVDVIVIDRVERPSAN